MEESLTNNEEPQGTEKRAKSSFATATSAFAAWVALSTALLMGGATPAIATPSLGEGSGTSSTAVVQGLPVQVTSTNKAEGEGEGTNGDGDGEDEGAGTEAYSESTSTASLTVASRDDNASATVIPSSAAVLIPGEASESSLQTASQASTATISLRGYYGQSEARGMLASINKFRTGSNAWYWNSDNKTKTTCKTLSKLKYSYSLEKTAMKRAMELALSFSHTRPDGTSCFTAYTGSNTAMGENIAAGYTSASSAFNGWCEANEKYEGQGHRRNMLSSWYTCVGIGHVEVNGVQYWVQEFGTDSTAAKTKATDGYKSVSVNYKAASATTKVAASSSSLKVAAGGTSAVPKVTASVQMADTWPARAVSGTAKVTWTVKNTKIAKLTSGKLQGLTVGSTTLVGKACGKTVKVAVKVVPPSVSSAKAIAGKKLVKLTWKKPSSSVAKAAVSGYKVRVAPSKSMKGATLVTVSGASKTSTTVTGLTSGKTYYVQICAYKKVGSKVVQGNWSKKMTARVKY